MRRTAALAALAASIALPAAAQSPLLTRDDSLAVGRQVIQLIYDSQVDSLWARLGERMRAEITSPDALRQEIDGIAVTLGTEVEVLQETVAPSEGGIRYTREVRFDARPDDIRVWAFDIASDGTIRSGTFRSKADFDQQKAPADSAARPSN